MSVYQWIQVGANIYDADVTSATTLTPETDATGAVLQSSDDAYVTLDGTTPASTNGFLLTSSMGPVYFPLQGADAVKVISAAGVIRGAWVKL